MSQEVSKPVISELTDYMIWQKTMNTGFVKYAASKLTPDLAITVTKLFWPDFTIYDDCVFLTYKTESSGFKKSFTSWKEHFKGDKEAVEKMINHIHLAQDLLIYPFENLGYDNIAYFGNILVKTWKCALAEAFPDRRFQVSGEKDGDFDDFVITFWQQSS